MMGQLGVRGLKFNVLRMLKSEGERERWSDRSDFSERRRLSEKKKFLPAVYPPKEGLPTEVGRRGHLEH